MEKILLSVPTLLGTESIVANEVRNLGYETTEVIDGRVTFEGDLDAICIANIFLRSAGRVMIKMGEFKALTFEDLFQGIKRINWERYIEKDGKFPVTGYSLKSVLHSIPDCQAIIKKAIVDRLASKYHIEWFKEDGATYPIHFGILKDRVSVYIDTSGDNLYKRGYRAKMVDAAMRETLAFAMVDMSFWRGDRPFMDPFCGSGTIPIEAAMYALNIAPGKNRHFAAETWKNHISPETWADYRLEATENETRDKKPFIIASDIDPKAVDLARANAKKAGVYDNIIFKTQDVRDAKPFKEKGVIICNPPYGERMMDAKRCEKLYKAMGEKFSEFTEAKKLILTSHEKFEECYGKKADKKRKLYNGMLKCYVYQYFK